MTLSKLAYVTAISVALAAPVSAEKLSLDTLSDYMNGLTNVQTEFSQRNGDGSISTGQLFIKRPGRMRFEYDPPDKTLVLSHANTVAIFDGRSNQPPETYPLKRTPLGLILAKDVDLSNAEMVVGHEEVDGYTAVIAQDPENPDYGRIELRFSSEPVALREWVVFDASGGRTAVLALRSGRG